MKEPAANATFYVVMAFDCRIYQEWVCGIFSNKEVAVAAAQEHQQQADKNRSAYNDWLICNSKARQEWEKANGDYGWNAPDELVVSKCGPPPDDGEADFFNVLEIPLDIWGKWRADQ